MTKRNEDTRPMAFIEVGRGSLGKDVQEMFEEAQAVSANRGVITSISLKITVRPPSDDAESSYVEYSLALKQPPKNSKVHEVRLQDGMIVMNAEEPLEQLNLLGDSLPETIEFKKSNQQ